jgi:hypothetical protein
VSRRQVGICSLIVGLVALAWLVLPLRIADPELNQIASLLFTWLVPLSLGAASFLLPRRRWLKITVTLPFYVLAVAWPLLLALMMIAGGPFRGYEVLDSLDLRYSRVVAYRINGGATVDYYVEIVQEMPVFPGMVLAKRLHYGYHEYAAALQLNQGDSVVVTLQGKKAESRAGNTTSEYRVRNFVYF